MKKILSQLPIQILIAICSALFLTSWLTLNTASLLYSLSCLIKDALMLFLPLITFSYIFYAMLKFARSAPMLILLVIFTLILSNLISFTSIFMVSQYIMPKFLPMDSLNLTQSAQEIHCLFSVPIPDIWSPKSGMLTGLALGILMSFYHSEKMHNFSQKIKDLSTNILNKYFIPFLPLFIFGFVVKLQFEGAIISLMRGYGKVLLITIPLFITYMSIFFLLANKGRIKDTVQHIKDCSGALITAFSTMSSITSLPLMFKATEKHIDNDNYTHFIIPGTINIHLLGDSIIFATTICALLLLYQHPFPSPFELAKFIGFYCLSRFSVAAVPSGSALVTMPLTQRYLGFGDEIAGVFLTLGILQDALITLGNTGGNCAFAKLTYNLFGKKILGRIDN